MQQITKSEMEWLLANNFLTVKQGKLDYLIVTSRTRGKGHKDRYVADIIYRHLSKMKKNTIINPNLGYFPPSASGL